MTKVLIYAQDPGGAQSIALVAKRLVEKNEASITTIVHPLARTAFDEFGVPFQLITDRGFHLPLGEKQAEDFLSTDGFTHILCGTSNPHYDPSNANLIKAARKLGICSFGFLEHWKGWERFYDEDGELAYVPDLLGCIDDSSAGRLEQLGIPRHKLIIVGHPYLEWIYMQMQTGAFRRQSSRKNVILVSQPMVKEGFKSIFSLPIGGVSLGECISSTLEELRGAFDFVVSYRPHPKEKELVNLPQGVSRDKQQKWIDSLKEADIVIGLDSMALIEAFCAEKICISLKLPELEGISDMFCPFKFSWNTSNLAEFKRALTHALAEDRECFPSTKGCQSLVEGSTQRTVAAFLDFLK